MTIEKYPLYMVAWGLLVITDERNFRKVVALKPDCSGKKRNKR